MKVDAACDRVAETWRDCCEFEAILSGAAIAANPQEALESGEMRDWLGLAIGRINVGDAGRVGAAPGAPAPVSSG